SDHAVQSGLGHLVCRCHDRYDSYYYSLHNIPTANFRRRYSGSSERIIHTSPMKGGFYMNQLQLNNKVILITGALGALGSSAIQMFLERGASLAACDIKSIDSSPKIDALARQFGEQRLLYIQADVTDEEQVKHVMEKTKQVFGRLDGSYHNAYVNNYRSIAEQTLEEWEGSIRGTLTSTFLVCKYATQLMIES